MKLFQEEIDVDLHIMLDHWQAKLTSQYQLMYHIEVNMWLKMFDWPDREEWVMMGKDVDQLKQNKKRADELFLEGEKISNIQFTINLILCWPIELDLQL